MRTRFLRGTTAENNGLTLPEGELSIDLEKKAVRLHDGQTLGGFEVVGTQSVMSGSQIIATDGVVDFYGEVPDTELFTRTELSTITGMSSGVELSDAGFSWLKFGFNGKILFVASKNVRSNVTVNELYNLGLVYGTDTVGAFPPTTGVNQNTLLTKNNLTFKVRLLNGSVNDPSGAERNVNVFTDGPGSEWDELLKRVHSDYSPGGDWPTYTNEFLDIKLNRYSFVKETHTHTTYSRIMRGYHGLLGMSSNIPQWRSSSGCWRPVLELVQ